jgi:hypothetical protein
MAKEAIDMTLEELAQQMNFRADSLPHLAASAEFIRRQTKAQLDASAATIEAANAEKLAAEAAVDSAGAMRANARYMLWSVIVAAVSAIASASAAYLAYASLHASDHVPWWG